MPNMRTGVTLGTADYSIGFDGQEYVDAIAVERKSLPDFYGCIRHEEGCRAAKREMENDPKCGKRCRFKRELARLTKLPYPALVIEGSQADILAGVKHSDVHPHAAMGSLIAWSVQYRLPVWLCTDRRAAAATTYKILLKALEAHTGIKIRD